MIRRFWDWFAPGEERAAVFATLAFFVAFGIAAGYAVSWATR